MQFLALNHDVLVNIASFLERPRDILAAACSCRHMREIYLPYVVRDVDLRRGWEILRFAAFISREPQYGRHIRSLSILQSDTNVNTVEEEHCSIAMLLKLAVNLHTLYLNPAEEALANPVVASALRGCAKLAWIDLQQFDHDNEIHLSYATCKALGALHSPLRTIRLASLIDLPGHPLLLLRNFTNTLTTVHLSFGSYLAEWKGPMIVWPCVRELHLMRSSLCLSQLEHAFPNLELLDIEHDPFLDYDPNRNYTCVKWQELIRVSSDAGGLSEYPLRGCHVHHLKVHSIVSDYSDDDYITVRQFVETTRPSAFSISLPVNASGQDVMFARVLEAVPDLVMLQIEFNEILSSDEPFRDRMVSIYLLPGYITGIDELFSVQFHVLLVCPPWIKIATNL
jgi:hypothetical protein